jgi:hypothetical protein
MGAYSKLNRPILVMDYDPQWPVLFEQEKEKIIAALGHNVLMVQHIGSTTVPGLAAKPTIDIGVGIRSLADASVLIPRIEKLAYVYEPALEQLLPERRFFLERYANRPYLPSSSGGSRSSSVGQTDPISRLSTKVSSCCTGIRGIEKAVSETLWAGYRSLRDWKNDVC